MRWVPAVAVVSMALAVGAAPARADWQEPVGLSSVGTPAGVPCETGRPSVAAASRDGSFLVAWQRKLGAQSNDNTLIEGRRIDRDGTIGPLLQLSDTPANLGTVVTAMGPDGAGIVVWHHLPAGDCGGVPGPILLEARRVGADGALGPVTPVIDPSASDKALDTAVAVNRSGDATVAWVDQIGFEQAVLKVRQLPATGPPGPVFTLTPTLGTAEEVVLVVDQHDRTLAVWNQHGRIQAQRLSPAGDPLPGVIAVSPLPDTSASLDVGIAANGEARVTWTRFDPSPLAILTRTIGADDTLGPIEVVAGGGGRPEDDRPVEARVAVNSSGAAAVAWFTSPNAAPDFVYGRVLLPSGAMAPAVLLSGPSAGQEMTPGVTLAANGAALAIWQRDLGNTGIVEAASFSAGGAEGPATQLSPPVGTVPFPDLAGTLRGDAVAAWGQETDGGNGMKIEGAQFCRRPDNGSAKGPPCRRAGKPSQ